MSSPDDNAAYDQSVIRVYLIGLESELETKLQDVRRIRQALEELNVKDTRVREGTLVRAFAEQFDRMLITNRVVRETLMQLRESTLLLLQRLQTPPTSEV